MAFFNFKRNSQKLFGADCMKLFCDSAAQIGMISGKNLITNEELMQYGDVGISFFLKRDPKLYGGLEQYCQNAVYFALQLGLILGSHARYDKLSHEYLLMIINSSPADVGDAYLELLELNDSDHPFYLRMISDFMKIYGKHLLNDENREYMKQALIVLYSIGNTISLS